MHLVCVLGLNRQPALDAQHAELLGRWIDRLPKGGAGAAAGAGARMSRASGSQGGVGVREEEWGVSALPLEAEGLLRWQTPSVARLPTHFHELLRDTAVRCVRVRVRVCECARARGCADTRAC